jgi:hypothetical protein
MKDRIKNLLREALNIPAFRLPQQIEVSPEDLSRLKTIKYEDILIDDLGGEGSIAHLGVSFPFETNASDGIIIDIQILQGMIYQLHLQLSDSLQGIGLGGKLAKAVIKDLGHIYSGKGRILNPNAKKMLDSIKSDPNFVYIPNDRGELYMMKGNPDEEKLKVFMV